MDETTATSVPGDDTLGHATDTARDEVRRMYAFAPEAFEGLLTQLVATQKPRLFSLCAIAEDRFDGWVAAWGMATEGEAIVVPVNENSLGIFQSPESALLVMSGGKPERMRLIWCDET